MHPEVIAALTVGDHRRSPRLGRGWVPSSPSASTEPPPWATRTGRWSDEVDDVDRPDEDDLAAVEASASVSRDDVESPVSQASPGRHRRPHSDPSVLTLPSSLRGARLHVSWPAVIAVAVVLLVATVVFAVRVAATRVAAAPRVVSTAMSVTRTSLPPAFATASTTGATDATAGQVSTGPTSTAVAATVVVDVAGQVSTPGVVRLRAGSRVVDAVARAGGATGRADLTRLNLARVLVDGEQVYVPLPGEVPLSVLGPSGSGGAGGSVAGAASGAPSSGASATSQVDLNAADLAALDGLPGVGPVLAQRILDWRTQHGRFTSIDELGEVSGIGDKVLSNLRPLVRV